MAATDPVLKPYHENTDNWLFDNKNGRKMKLGDLKKATIPFSAPFYFFFIKKHALAGKNSLSSAHSDKKRYKNILMVTIKKWLCYKMW